MFGSGLPGGYHEDVLGAHPVDEEGKARLVEELKTRAKGSIKSKNYPEAIQLYSKGIELYPTNSILYANRSMCHLGMGNASGALADADHAIQNDAGYVKAYYRKGVALVSLKRGAEAREVFAQGLALAPDDKELAQQLRKVEEEAAVVKPVAPKEAPAAAPVIPKGKADTVVSKPKNSSTPSKATDAEGDEGSEAGIIRGYKKTSDGRTTSYFHNELDEETKALIGNIAPKKLEGVAAPVETGNNGAGSAWNTAGTVETVNHSPWATRRLEQLFEFLEVDLPGGGTVGVRKVKDTKGDAEVLIVRGKRKNVYDLSVELEWELRTRDEETGTGTISVTDISADLDMEISVTVDRSKGPLSAALNELVKTYVQSSKQGLQPAILATVNRFVQEFKDK